MDPEQGDEGTVVAWPRRYEGPVETAMRTHIGRVHAEDDVTLEIREPG